MPSITVPLPKNPCAGIQVALPRQPKEGNHAALPYTALPESITKLRVASPGIAVKLAMEFTILTAARTSEVPDAAWSEIDLEDKVWSIRAERMKMDEPHKMPLSDRCVTMLRALQRMEGYEELSMHGFRATFKTWAHEKTLDWLNLQSLCSDHHSMKTRPEQLGIEPSTRIKGADTSGMPLDPEHAWNQ